MAITCSKSTYIFIDFNLHYKTIKTQRQKNENKWDQYNTHKSPSKEHEKCH